MNNKPAFIYYENILAPFIIHLNLLLSMPIEYIAVVAHHISTATESVNITGQLKPFRKNKVRFFPMKSPGNQKGKRMEDAYLCGWNQCHRLNLWKSEIRFLVFFSQLCVSDKLIFNQWHFIRCVCLKSSDMMKCLVIWKVHKIGMHENSYITKCCTGLLHSNIFFAMIPHPHI